MPGQRVQQHLSHSDPADRTMTVSPSDLKDVGTAFQEDPRRRAERVQRGTVNSTRQLYRPVRRSASRMVWDGTSSFWVDLLI
jgi:TFIIF-interacting CTD phosphatase-like protein